MIDKQNIIKHEAGNEFFGPTFEEADELQAESVGAPAADDKTEGSEKVPVRIILPAESFSDINKPSVDGEGMTALVQRIEEHMPQLFHDYKGLVTPSEVPVEFHLFAFMTMMAALVGDKVSFIEGSDSIYPNLWTMLVGDSSIARKSTSFRPILNILNQTQEVNLLAQKGSPEGFFKDLQDHKGVGLMYHSELGSLLGALKKDYMGGMVEELCEYYDPSPVGLTKRLSQETIKVEHLAVSWIGATTPDSLERCDAHERISSGFLPRWNIVLGGPPNYLLPFRPARPVEEINGYAKKLKELSSSQKTPAIEFSTSAKQIYEEWYKQHRSKTMPDKLGPFQIRILEVVKKYSVLLAFMHKRKQVEDDDMGLAIQFGEYFFKTSEQLITKVVAENKDEKNMQKILKAIASLKAQGKATNKRNCYRVVHFQKHEFDRYMETLKARGLVELRNEEYRLLKDKN